MCGSASRYTPSPSRLKGRMTRSLPLHLALALVSLPATAWAQAVAPGPTMQDVDIGHDGDVFAVAAGSPSFPDGRIYQWIRGQWVEFGGLGNRITSDSFGRPWHINRLNDVYRWNGSTWLLIAGVKARAIDIGGYWDDVFIVRDDFRIARWNGTTFVDFGGSADEITVDVDGHPWVLASGQVWSHDGVGWRRHLGISGRDIDAQRDGTVALLEGGSATNGRLRFYRPATDSWSLAGLFGRRLTVAPTGAPAVLDTAGQLRGNFVRRIHGDTTCFAGESDCNVCAFDVRGQIAAQLGFGHKTSTGKQWDLDWTATYQPINLTPEAPFDDWVPFPFEHHVQGFVKTNSISYPYAGSYSDNDYGSVFTVRRYAGNPRLANIHETENDLHPSGLHALGRFVITNDNARVQVFDVENPANETEHVVPRRDEAFRSSGGGIGLVRLGPSEYLLSSTNPGGNDSGPRSTHFWRMQGALTGSATLTYLGGGEHRLPWASGYDHNENVTMITECGTGQIYALHSWGDQQLLGNGYWRLSRLEHDLYGPILRGIDGYTEGQNSATCHHRAAATAFVDGAGRIETYCHEYDASRAPGWVWDSVDFTQRLSNYANSCISSCGGQAPGGCWCDAACRGFGDCCNDEAFHCAN